MHFPTSGAKGSRRATRVRRAQERDPWVGQCRSWNGYLDQEGLERPAYRVPVQSESHSRVGETSVRLPRPPCPRKVDSKSPAEQKPLPRPSGHSMRAGDAPTKVQRVNFRRLAPCALAGRTRKANRTGQSPGGVTKVGRLGPTGWSGAPGLNWSAWDYTFPAEN